MKHADEHDSAVWMQRMHQNKNKQTTTFDNFSGRAIDEAVSRRLLTTSSIAVHVGFLVDKVAFLPVLLFSPVSIITPLLHTHSCGRRAH
jgi:hypothetical protein